MSRFVLSLLYPVASSHILVSSSTLKLEDILTSRSLPFNSILSSFILVFSKTIFSFSSSFFTSFSLKDSLKTTVIFLFIFPVGVISTICLYLLTLGITLTSTFKSADLQYPLNKSTFESPSDPFNEISVLSLTLSSNATIPS